MRTIVDRHLGKVVAGTAVAVAATAALVAVTLPGTAGAEGTGAGAGRSARQEAATAPAVAPGVVEPPAAEGERGTGRDPLTDDETRRAERIALSGRLFRSGENVAGGRGPQRLGVDLAEPGSGEAGDPAAPRRAEVTSYDYRNDTLVTRTVDLATGTVVRTSTQRGVQPPLSAAEKAEAAALLIADPLGAGLRADYKAATGTDLTSPDRLRLSGAVYRAAPGAGPAALDDCGEHRCVRLFPKVENGPWIDARSLVIDLSAREVATLGR
ncbi:Tat pathway signal sequence domain protein [Streptomyces sp. XY006]|uniref:Tat pathway signal sequence domain protein n=1 Tax=Streptomyces sp. XY006 TaxID=2021410 RepID=UPI000B8C1DAB|nr:Tat pathway signal sequence domain protein [Streptomyces sp. XY006]OXS35784.1 Tat pathway signal sequence domain protein [Streptomyces sp. XY006]